MSPEVEQPPAAGDLPVLDPPAPEPSEPTHGAHPGHHVLRESTEDRWKWRARIRQNAHQLRLYRFGVALVGTFLVVLGCVSGPLPGPGGIPLVLLGLAVWASEFAWAERVMVVFKAQLARFRSWTRPQQALGWAVFFACCGLVGYTSLLLVGPPSWLPASADAVLARLPGL